MRVRKRPVVVEAHRWFKNGDHPLDYPEVYGYEWAADTGTLHPISGAFARQHQWGGGVVRYFRRPDVEGADICPTCGHTMHDHGWIDTLEGGHIVCPGDYIITGVKGEHYPCKPDIFNATYVIIEA